MIALPSFKHSAIICTRKDSLCVLLIHLTLLLNQMIFFFVIDKGKEFERSKRAARPVHPRVSRRRSHARLRERKYALTSIDISGCLDSHLRPFAMPIPPFNACSTVCRYGRHSFNTNLLVAIPISQTGERTLKSLKAMQATIYYSMKTKKTCFTSCIYSSKTW